MYRMLRSSSGRISRVIPLPDADELKLCTRSGRQAKSTVESIRRFLADASAQGRAQERRSHGPSFCLAVVLAATGMVLAFALHDTPYRSLFNFLIPIALVAYNVTLLPTNRWGICGVVVLYALASVLFGSLQIWQAARSLPLRGGAAALLSALCPTAPHPSLAGGGAPERVACWYVGASVYRALVDGVVQIGIGLRITATLGHWRRPRWMLQDLWRALGYSAYEVVLIAIDVAISAAAGARPALFYVGAALMLGALGVVLYVHASPELREWLHARRQRQGAAIFSASGLAALISSGGSGADSAALQARALETLRSLRADKLTSAHLQSNEADAALFALTEPARVGEIDAFLSHSWRDDPTEKWELLQAWRARFVQAHRREPTLWLDKACLEQSKLDEQLALLPVYAAACSRFVVLLTPTYLQRLWCVAELFTWMHVGRSDDIDICLPNAHERFSGGNASAGAKLPQPGVEQRAGSSGALFGADSMYPQSPCLSAQPQPQRECVRVNTTSVLPLRKATDIPLPPGARPPAQSMTFRAIANRRITLDDALAASIAPTPPRSESSDWSRHEQPRFTHNSGSARAHSRDLKHVGGVARARARSDLEASALSAKLAAVRSAIDGFDVRAASCTSDVETDRLLTAIEVGFGNLDAFSAALRRVLKNAVAAAVIASNAERSQRNSDRGLLRVRTTRSHNASPSPARECACVLPCAVQQAQSSVLRVAQKALSGDWVGSGCLSSAGTVPSARSESAGVTQQEDADAPRDAEALAEASEQLGALNGVGFGLGARRSTGDAEDILACRLRRMMWVVAEQPQTIKESWSISAAPTDPEP